MFDMTERARRRADALGEAQLRKRRNAEIRLKALGIGAIALATLALVTLIWSVVFKAANALFEYYAPVEVSLDLTEEERSRLTDLNSQVVPDLTAYVEAGIAELAPDADADDQRALTSLLADSVGFDLGRMVKADPSMIGHTVGFQALLDDDAQLYLKDYYGELDRREVEGTLSPSGTSGEIELASSTDDFADELATVKQALVGRADRVREQAARQENAVEVYEQRIAAAEDETSRTTNERRLARAVEQRDELLAEAEALEARAEAEGGEEEIQSDMPSVFVQANGGWARATTISPDRIVAETLEPLDSAEGAPPAAWRLYVLETSPQSRNITDVQAIWLERLQERDRIDKVFNWRFFGSADSRSAALAGIWGALVGSALTMAVTFLLAFPIGVAASVYLEEFAPKNRLTNFIEVNINNLAAVPSIVFGLLGLAVALPLLNQLMDVNLRSAPLIGGVVLALMSLPTIIIASRAAIRAVPPSIREAALGVGASRLQAVFHHVLPLALPGILTGTIIALAQALGETAPLIMIGMVAFIVDVPGGVAESATVLPVQIYRWSDFPEKLFELKTALAICTLLVFLVAMNAIAVVLRRRFERRW